MHSIGIKGLAQIQTSWTTFAYTLTKHMHKGQVTEDIPSWLKYPQLGIS